MYKNNFVVSIADLSTNRFFNEQKNGLIFLPAETTYFIRIVNQNNYTVVAKVFVDDQSAGDFIIRRNDVLDLKRFVKNNNLEFGSSFKFVPVTKSDISTDVGKQRNGIIRVEFYKEKQAIRVKPYKYYETRAKNVNNSFITNSLTYTNSYLNFVNVEQSEPESEPAMATPVRQVESTGKTVEGENINQEFDTQHIEYEDTAVSIIELKLMVDTQTDLNYCTQCGHKLEKHFKFCPKCGNKI